MTEQDIRSLKIQPFQVAKVIKLLQREATFGELIKVFERDLGFNIFEEATQEKAAEMFKQALEDYFPPLPDDYFPKHLSDKLLQKIPSRKLL